VVKRPHDRAGEAERQHQKRRNNFQNKFFHSPDRPQKPVQTVAARGKDRNDPGKPEFIDVS
jgi:hypothetical protein